MAVSARIQQIYLALFGRPADPVGGEFYDTLTHDGSDLTAILTGSSRLSGSAEYTSRFTGMSNTQIVETIYQSLFGHPADLAGLTFYTQAMANADAQANGQPLPFPAVPTYTIEQIAVGILDGATGTDAAIIANKTAAAVEFTDSLDTPAEIAAYQGDNAADFGRDFINHVTADPASIPTQAQVDAALMDLTTNVANGLSVNLTSNVDDVTTNAADTLHTSAANDVIRGIVDGNAFGGASTFNNGDQINGGEGYDRVEITNVTNFSFSGDPTVIATLDNVEELSVRNAGSYGLNLDATTWDASLEKVTLHDSGSEELSIDGLKSNVDFNFVNTDGYISVDYAAGTLGANATIDVSVSNSDSSLYLYHDDADTISTLNVDSSGTSGNDSWNDFSFYDEDGNGDLTKVVVTGDSAVELYVSDISNVAMVDASANTGGIDIDLEYVDVDVTVKGSSNDDYIYVDMDHNVTATLGAGDDYLEIYSGLVTSGSSLNGGDGFDTLTLDDLDNLATPAAQTLLGNVISNFEELEIDASISSDLTIDLAKLDNISTVYQYYDVYNNATLTLDNFASGGTFELDDNVQSGSSVVINVANDTSHDVVNVVLDNVDDYSINGTLDVTGFETVNFTTNGGGSSYGYIGDLVTDATTVTVTGENGIYFNTSLGTNLTTFDGSGVTGTGSTGEIYLSTSTSNTHDLTITTGAGDDQIYTYNQNDTINTGAGDDTIAAYGGADTITTGTGDDTVVYYSVSDSSAGSVDTITDFTSGSDTIDLSNISYSGVATYNGEAASYAAALTALTGGGDASAVLDTSTHQLYFDVNGDGTIGAGDMIITLTGVSDLTNGTHTDVQF